MTTIINGRFTLGRVLGSGMQAEVRKGIDNNSNKAVALKIIDKTKLRRRTLEALEREVDIMKAIRHRNVLRLKAVAMDTTIENKTVAVLVLEIAEGGELFEFLMHTKHFEEVLARTYFHQLVSALQCCHDQNIYHRDIKPENILMSATYELKLADFGLGNYSAEDESDLLETECGTRSYMAPEIMAHKGYRGDMADIWSAGVVLFIMLVGSPPFDVAARTDWWFNACSLARYDRFWAAHLRGAAHMTSCVEAQDLLNRIFVPNPERRITLEEVCGHAWMQGPVLDDAALKEVMHLRSLQIKGVQVQGREAMLSRQGGVKRGIGSQEGGAKQGSVDVFKRNTHRSVAKPLPKYEASALSPMYGEASAGSYQFFCQGAEDVLPRLTRQLLALDPTAKLQASSEEYTVQASLLLPGDSFELDGEVICTPGAPLDLTVCVFQAPPPASASGEEEEEEEEGLLLVTVHRKAGAITAFQKCFLALRDQVMAELDQEEKVAGEGMAPGKQEEEEQQEEEEELSEDLGMI